MKSYPYEASQSEGVNQQMNDPTLVARGGEEFRFRDRDQDWIGM